MKKLLCLAMAAVFCLAQLNGMDRAIGKKPRFFLWSAQQIEDSEQNRNPLTEAFERHTRERAEFNRRVEERFQAKQRQEEADCQNERDSQINLLEVTRARLLEELAQKPESAELCHMLQNLDIAALVKHDLGEEILN
jgi:hypothetical protein